MKPFLATCLCLLSLPVFCQVRLGIDAGFHRNILPGREEQVGLLTDYSYKTHQPGFQAGAMAYIPLAKRVSVQPSLLLSEKGAKEKFGSGGFAGDYTLHLRLYYAHLPVQVMYIIVNGKKLQLLAGAGFFISKGIWGTSKGTFLPSMEIEEQDVDLKVRFTSDPDDEAGKRNIKPWDAGYTIAAAGIWKSWQLKAAYDFGAVKIFKNQFSKPTYRTGVLSLSAGYYFTHKRARKASGFVKS